MDYKNLDSFVGANHKKTPSEFHQNYNVQDCLSNAEKQCLVEDIKNLLSGGIVKIELTPQAWCSLLKFAVEEYISDVQMWLIQNQWSSLNGKSLTQNDMCFALTQRSFDYELQFAQAYSKQVGLQSRGSFELKKDYFILEEGKMVYEVPAGREINQVMWLTPSDITHATFASLGYGTILNGVGVTGAVGWGGSGYNILNGAYYIAPAYDIVARAADFGLKNRILKSDLTYKITAGANGTHLVHLYSTPEKKDLIGIRKELYGMKVWYHYYDTTEMNAEEKNKCLEECADIIKYPSDVPMTMTDFCDLNSPSKVWVRKFLTALAKEALGRARGKFKGKLPFPEADGELDYDSLLAEGKEEKDKLKETLKAWLDEMTREKIMEKRAAEAENLNKILSKNPNGFWVI
jgi:hypothetical protein